MAQTSTRPCSFAGCPRGQQAKGYCKAHYEQLRAGKELYPIPTRPRGKPCRAEGCAERAIMSRSYCETHRLLRLAAQGKPTQCSFDDCGRVPKTRGLCQAHYLQWLKGGHLVPLMKNNTYPEWWSFLEKDRFRRYGVSPERFAEILAAQGGVCPGCLLSEPKGGAWALDHCHAAGAPRRVFCGNCNKAYGFAQEDPAILTRLADLAKADRQLKLVI